MDTVNRFELEKQLRDAPGMRKMTRRIQAHMARVQRIRAGVGRRSVGAPAPRQLPLDFLAIGDSWFEYPLTDDGLLTGFNQEIVGRQVRSYNP